MGKSWLTNPLSVTAGALRSFLGNPRFVLLTYLPKRWPHQMYRRWNHYDRVRSWQIPDRYPIVWKFDPKLLFLYWSANSHVWAEHWPRNQEENVNNKEIENWREIQICLIKLGNLVKIPWNRRNEVCQNRINRRKLTKNVAKLGSWSRFVYYFA